MTLFIMKGGTAESSPQSGGVGPILDISSEEEADGEEELIRNSQYIRQEQVHSTVYYSIVHQTGAGTQYSILQYSSSDRSRYTVQYITVQFIRQEQVHSTVYHSAVHPTGAGTQYSILHYSSSDRSRYTVQYSTVM